MPNTELRRQFFKIRLQRAMTDNHVLNRLRYASDSANGILDALLLHKPRDGEQTKRSLVHRWFTKRKHLRIHAQMVNV